ncbi:MAG TPA: helix-turn-helix domain-containing protein, partial [Acidimicrobiales bacterium]|nr:helix-turn-helix domain-containing protein [Acidimicrobiales bacterium]
MTQPPLRGEEFSAAVAAVTAALGDPTRRDIYLFVRGHGVGVTASQVALEFRLHPNVARHHLDKLGAQGYVDVHVERPGGTGAGRPSKRYRASGKPTDLELPSKRADLLATLLARALELLPAGQAEALAEAVGEEHGRQMAAEMAPDDTRRSRRAAVEAVAEALTAHGFAAHTERRAGAIAIISEQCPFGVTPGHSSLVCAVDRGMIKGMVSVL